MSLRTQTVFFLHIPRDKGVTVDGGVPGFRPSPRPSPPSRAAGPASSRNSPPEAFGPYLCFGVRDALARQALGSSRALLFPQQKPWLPEVEAVAKTVLPTFQQPKVSLNPLGDADRLHTTGRGSQT